MDLYKKKFLNYYFYVGSVQPIMDANFNRPYFDPLCFQALCQTSKLERSREEVEGRVQRREH